MANSKEVRATDIIQVNIELRGRDAELFRSYMKQTILRSKAAAGFKLMMERLHEVMPATSAPAKRLRD